MATQTFTFTDNMQKTLLTHESDASAEHLTVTSCKVLNDCDEVNECQLIINAGEGVTPRRVSLQNLEANETVDLLISPSTVLLERGFSLEFICSQPETNVTLKWS